MWIKVTDKLPPANSRVLASWGPTADNVAELEYREETVRKKIVHRWKWNGALSPWQITHWMEFPPPPTSEECREVEHILQQAQAKI
jgi:hypothetical protein